MQGWFNIREYINIIYHINKSKNHIMTAINSEKIFDKFNIYYVLQLLMKLEYMNPSLNDRIYSQSKRQYHFFFFIVSIHYYSASGKIYLFS